MTDTSNYYMTPGAGRGYGGSSSGQYQASAAPGIGSFKGIGSISPYQDPTFDAYVAGLGVNENNLGAEVALRNNQLNQQSAQQAPVFGEELTNGLRSIGGNFEDRGSFNSGRRMYDQTQYGSDIARQQNNYNENIQSQRDSLQQQLAGQIASDNVNKTGQALKTQQSLAQMYANAGMYQ